MPLKPPLQRKNRQLRHPLDLRRIWAFVAMKGALLSAKTDSQALLLEKLLIIADLISPVAGQDSPGPKKEHFQWWRQQKRPEKRLLLANTRLAETRTSLMVSGLEDSNS